MLSGGGGGFLSLSKQKLFSVLCSLVPFGHHQPMCVLT